LLWLDAVALLDLDPGVLFRELSSERAGVDDLLFAWGGHEGTHTVANISTSLLGGTSRPSLF
jgi:hypothetical protein